MVNHAPETPDAVYQAILNIRSRDSSKRSEAIPLIPYIAKYLGADRTTQELIPYITESPNLTEDMWVEALRSIAKIDIRSYNSDQINRLLKELRVIAELESHSIRKVFIECICTIFYVLDQEIQNDIFYDFLEYLLTNEWTPSKVSGIYIYAALGKDIPKPIFEKFFKIYIDSRDEDSVFVKKTMIISGQMLMRTLSPADTNELLSVVQSFVEDKSASITCEIPKFLVKYVHHTKQIDKIHETIPLLLESQNWRVRCATFVCFTDIFKESHEQANNLLTYFEKAVEDADNEVRTAASQQLSFISTLNNVDVNRAKALVKNFLNDRCQHVRTSVVTILPHFAQLCGVEFVTSHLLDLIADQSSEVKIAAIEALKSSEIPRETAIDCITTIAENSKQWREKKCLTDLLTEIIHDKPLKNLGNLIKLLLTDDASDVRMSMIEKLPFLISKFGMEWARKALIPVFIEASNDEDYKLRQMAVIAIVKTNLLEIKECMEIVEKAASDEVCNVRLIVAKSIPRKYTKIIKKLEHDQDPDVCEQACNA